MITPSSAGPTHCASPEPGAPLFAPTWGQAVRLWFRIGCLSVGGPVAQVALLHQEVVARRGWVSEARFSRALAYCTVLPGPEAQQLATYLGWMLHGWPGALAAGLLFILPGLLVVLGLAALVWWSDQAVDLRFWTNALMPAVLALVGVAAARMARKSLKTGALQGHGWVLWLVVAGLGFGVHLFQPSAWPFVVLSLVGLAWLGDRLGLMRPSAEAPPGLLQGRAGSVPADCSQGVKGSGVNAVPPEPSRPWWGLTLGLLAATSLWGLSVLALVGMGATPGLIQMALFFTQAALVTVGGAYAVLPYVHDAVVSRWAWVSAEQFGLGLALGETTPGPLVLVLSFVGFMAGANPGGAELLAGASAPVRGLLLGLMVTFYTFFPSFVFILLGAPWIERGLLSPALKSEPSLVERVLNAAVVGMMLGLLLHLAAPVVLSLGTGTALIGGLNPLGLARLALAMLSACALWAWPERSVQVLFASTAACMLMGTPWA